MLILALVLVTVGIVIAILVWPRLSVLLIWPILLLYPNALWIQAKLIPLEIGFDDLYILGAFVLVFFHRRVFSGRPSNLGFPVRAAFAFVVIVVISNISGSLQIARDVDIDRSTLKDALKVALVVPFTFSIANAIDDWKQLRRFILAMSIALTAAAALTIVTQFKPHLIEYFWEAEARHRTRGGVYTRATGSFVYANTLGIVMSLGIILNLVCLALFKKVSVRGLLIVGAGVMFTALLLSRSRTGLICLGAGFFGVLAMRGRTVAVVAAIAVVPVVLLLPATLEGIGERFELVYSADTGELGSSVAERFALQKLYFSELDVLGLLVGRGVYPGGIITGTLQKPHNGFVDLICFYGIFGVIWLGVVMYYVFCQLRFLLTRARGSEAAHVAKMGMLMLVVLATGSLTADTITNSKPLYFFFAVLVIIDSAYRTAWSWAQDADALPLADVRYGG